MAARASEAFRPNPSFEPATGTFVEIAEGMGRVTAPNAGPYTLTGTNTFILGIDQLVVIDPGPADARHMRALLTAIADRPVKAILLTHTHRDHTGLARRLRQRTGAPIWCNGRHRFYRPPGRLEAQVLKRSCDLSLEPDEIIEDGQVIDVDGFSLGVIATPGHCANHLAFSVTGSPFLFTGDHVMGWSSTVVAPPDGAMGDYLHSLDRVIIAPFTHYLPAHGGPIPDGRRYARSLLAHRLERNRQILEGLAEGTDTIAKLVRRIYEDLAPALRPAAAKTVEAHLDYLVGRGEAKARRGLFGTHYRRA